MREMWAGRKMTPHRRGSFYKRAKASPSRNWGGMAGHNRPGAVTGSDGHDAGSISSFGKRHAVPDRAYRNGIWEASTTISPSSR